MADDNRRGIIGLPSVTVSIASPCGRASTVPLAAPLVAWSCHGESSRTPGIWMGRMKIVSLFVCLSGINSFLCFVIFPLRDLCFFVCLGFCFVFCLFIFNLCFAVFVFVFLFPVSGFIKSSYSW